jgi:sec-independent protein translocase protein TatB
MEFLGIGPLELLFILLIALIILGPKDLEKTAKNLGKGLNKLVRSDTWKTVTDASRELRTLPNKLMREANLEELQEMTAENLGAPVSDAQKALKAWTNPPGATLESLVKPAASPQQFAPSAEVPPQLHEQGDSTLKERGSGK